MFDKNRGFLVLIGGAEDKKDKKEILRYIVDINNANTISIIPSASSYTYELGRKYEETFKSIGVENVKNLDIRYKDEADRKEYNDFVLESDLIFFTGGDQVKLVKTLKNTEILIRIWQKYYNGTTIAGTSAGAAAASETMIYDGDYQELQKNCVNSSDGFGFIKNITIDTHFIERCRLPRLSQFLVSGDSNKGIGIGEDTAIVVHPEGSFKVIGNGVVTVLDAERTYSDYNQKQQKDQVTIDGLSLGFLSTNTFFDMNKWRVITPKKDNSLKHKFNRLRMTIDRYIGN